MLGIIILMEYCLFILLLFFDEVLKEIAFGFCFLGLMFAKFFSLSLVYQAMVLLILIMAITEIIKIFKGIRKWRAGRKKG